MRTSAALCLLVSLLAVPTPGRCDDARLREVARKLMGRYGPALVVVRLTVKPRMVMEGREESGPESTVEAAGTLVSPDGLTVLSDFTTNPTALFQREGGPRFENDVTDVKLLLQDGRELPARFVLRDADLDLAFVAPVEPCTSPASVRFEKGAVPGPLDDLVYLAQLGKSLNRAVAVTTGRVRAVVSKPRTFLVPGSSEGLSELGSPAFDEKGRPVGLVVLRRSVASAADSYSLRAWAERTTAVVLTAGDVQELASQAQAARAKLGQGEASAAP